MCVNCSELYILQKSVDSLWKHNGERWSIIQNASNMLEVIPEKSLSKIDPKNKIIYTLKK